MTGTDDLDLAVVREHLGERLAKGEHEELLADVLGLVEKLGRRTAFLEFELMRLRKAAQGRKSEKVDPAQLELLMKLVSESDKQEVVALDSDEDFDATIDAELAQVDDDDLEPDARSKQPKRRPARRKPPAHLPIRERVLEPELVGCEWECIGYDESHTLDWEPGRLIHVITKRNKYAPPTGDGPVVIASLPPQVITRGLAEAGLLAHVIVSKYGDHIPLRRQAKIFGREGVDVAVSSMVNWIRECTKMLAPLVSLLGAEVLAAHLVQTDDTGLQVRDAEEEDGCKRGHLWGYVGDGVLAYFEYTSNWKAEAAQTFLAKREGWLQADAYKGYDAVFSKLGSKVIEVGCWAHARRYFVEAKDGGDARGAVPLALIQRIYKVERKAKLHGLKHEARLQLRKKHSRTLLDQLYAWIVKHRGIEPPSSPLARAMTYAINQREALMRFLEDGRLPLDNTGAERALRGIAVGRKNWMFAGNDDSGGWAAVMYSLIRSCELNGVEPWKYLRDVLTRLAEGWPEERLGELLPHCWSALRD